MRIEDFEEVWLVDFGAHTDAAGKVRPMCLSALEFFTGVRRSFELRALNELSVPPYRTDERTIFVAYDAREALRCHLALGWSSPFHVLDLFIEFRNITNGKVPASKSAVGEALSYFGLPINNAHQKQAVYSVFAGSDQLDGLCSHDLMSYAIGGTQALEMLLRTMCGTIELPYALNHGKFMKAVAKMETRGVPLDGLLLSTIKLGWSTIREALTHDLDHSFGFYEGSSFRRARLENWVSDRRSVGHVVQRQAF